MKDQRSVILVSREDQVLFEVIATSSLVSVVSRCGCLHLVLIVGLTFYHMRYDQVGMR